MIKKIRRLSIIITFMLLLQIALYPTNTMANNQQGITLEQAIQLVKDNFHIPENYSHLSTGYNEFSNLAVYSLNWSSDGQPFGSFNAEVDAISGEILSISQWNESLSSSFKLPVLSSEDAAKIASDLIERLAGKHLSEMELIKEKQQVFILNDAQPFMYKFRWTRVVNGIPFPENGIAVSVSGEDGLIINYNYNWTEHLEFPTASKVISLEKVRQIFTDTPMLELQYLLPPMDDSSESDAQRILLVYRLTNKYYGGAIDALTGEPVTLNKQIFAQNSMTTEAPIPITGSLPAIKTTFKPASMQEDSSTIESSESLGPKDNSRQISQEEALEIVKKTVAIPKDFGLRNSSLNPDWQNPKELVWELYWSSESVDDGEQGGYLNARVNAQTGDLVSFNMSYGNSNEKSKPVSRKEAQIIADNFLKRVQPERFELVRLEAEDFYGGQLPSNIQMFSYVRYVNGIPVFRNGMYLTVDTAAKEVVNYEMNWLNQEFPMPGSVLSLHQATERFLQIRPLALKYTLLFEPNGQPHVRLVYLPKSDYDLYVPAILDARTGDPMDWTGNPQSKWFTANIFTDIMGNYAEKEIAIIGLTGAFGEYGDVFRPEEKITLGSLLRAMLTAEGSSWDRVLSDTDVLKVSKERGWIHEDVKLESELSREDLSKFMIRLVNMESSAQVKGIYAVPFTDANMINPDSLGYIALAWGLGIIKVEHNTLSPNQAATRAEAAYALVHAYMVGRSMNSYTR